MNINSSSNYMEDIFSFNQPIPKEGQQQQHNNQRKLSDADDDDLYAILGCHYSASTEQITAEYRARALELHPDKCSATSSDGETERKFCRLQRAKEILLDEERRRDYDRWRDSGLAVTYRKWCELNAFGGLHNSIHWFSASGGRDRKPALMDINSRANQQQQFPELPLDPRLQDPRFVQNPSKSCIIESEFRRSTGEKTCPLLKQFRNYEI